MQSAIMKKYEQIIQYACPHNRKVLPTMQKLVDPKIKEEKKVAINEITKNEKWAIRTRNVQSGVTRESNVGNLQRRTHIDFSPSWTKVMFTIE